MGCVELRRVKQKKHIIDALNKSVDSFTSDISIDQPNSFKLKKRKRINKNEVANELISSSLYISSIINELSKNKEKLHRKIHNLSLYNSFFLYSDLLNICPIDEQIEKNEELFNPDFNYNNEQKSNNHLLVKESYFIDNSISNSFVENNNFKDKQMEKEISRISFNIINQNNVKSCNLYNGPSIQFKSELTKSGINLLSKKDEFLDTSLNDYLNEERAKINDNPNYIKEKIRRNNINSNNNYNNQINSSRNIGKIQKISQSTMNQSNNIIDKNSESFSFKKNNNKIINSNSNNIGGGNMTKIHKKNKFKTSNIKIDLRDALKKIKNINISTSENESESI